MEMSRRCVGDKFVSISFALGYGYFSV
jgi:hypothetical protein